MENQRGNHTHEYPCGASAITHNLEDQTTRIDSTWNNCDLNSSDMFMDGTFSLDGNFRKELLELAIEGDLTIGGGIPKIMIRKLESSFEEAKPSSSQFRISGKIYGEADERAFSFDLIVDG